MKENFYPDDLVIKLLILKKSSDPIQEIVKFDYEIMKNAIKESDKRPYFNIFVVEKKSPEIKELDYPFTVYFDNTKGNFSDYRINKMEDKHFGHPIKGRLSNYILDLEELSKLNKKK